MNGTDFQSLVIFLRNKGYKVEISDEIGLYKEKYKFASVKGKGIRAGFCTENNSSYHYLRNKICADNAKCFDKWSKCPLVMKLPVDKELLYKHFQFLGSKEGYEISNSYDYLDNNPFPYEMK